MSNEGPKHGEGITKAIGVATDVVLITPHDTVDNIPDGTRALLVGTGGTINVTTLAGNNHDGVPVPTGIVPLSLKRIRTGGTATDIWALV